MSHDDNKRLAKNTIILYIRMIVMSLLGFFTTRVTLEMLGIENYGIYNVVGGVVGIMSIVTNSLSVSTSRFITIGLGKGDLEDLKRIFGASMNIQICLALTAFVLFETIGLWFLNHKLDIPADRMFAANIVFQLSIITALIGLLSTPYNALIVAHEKMGAFAWMTIFDAVSKLAIVLVLFYAKYDRLILYALFLCLQSCLTQLIYWRYGKTRFEECRYTLVKEKSYYKEMFGFAGWNFIGSTAYILNTQGTTILLNIFFGPLVNAAYAIGNQVNSIISRFTSNFMMALNPQITKNYACRNHDRVNFLLFAGSKFSYFLFLFLSLPILLETPKILDIWLVSIPPYTATFVRLMIIWSLVTIISNPLITAQLATGKIKKYQICVGGTLLLALPITYLLFKMGMKPATILVVQIFIAQICLFERVYLLKDMIGLSFRKFIVSVYLKCVITTLAAVPVPLIIYLVMPDSILRLLTICVVSCIFTGISIYFVGCNDPEKALLRNAFYKLKSKVIRK